MDLKKVATINSGKVTSSSDREARFTAAPQDNKYEVLKATRPALIQKYIDEGKITLTARNLDEATPIVGECLDMCPEFERHERELQYGLDALEKIPGTEKVDHSRAVKRFSRSAAGSGGTGEDNELPNEVRPPHILVETVNYLFHTVLAENGLKASYGFVRDRTRAVRKDFTVQHTQNLQVVECCERIARYHIMCCHELCEDPVIAIQQEHEQMRKTLQSLRELYAILTKKGIVCPNEAEFQSYYILSHIYQSEITTTIELLRPEVFNDPRVQKAIHLQHLVARTNEHSRSHPRCEGSPNLYSVFFKIVSGNKCNYLESCLLHLWFVGIRKGALKAMQKAFYNFPNTPETFVSINKLILWLGLDSSDDAYELLEYYHIPFDKNLGVAHLGKRREMFNGKPKMFAGAFIENKKVSFPTKRSNRLVSSKRLHLSDVDIIDGVLNSNNASTSNGFFQNQHTSFTTPSHVQQKPSNVSFVGDQRHHKNVIRVNPPFPPPLKPVIKTPNINGFGQSSSKRISFHPETQFKEKETRAPRTAIILPFHDTPPQPQQPIDSGFSFGTLPQNLNVNGNSVVNNEAAQALADQQAQALLIRKQQQENEIARLQQQRKIKELQEERQRQQLIQQEQQKQQQLAAAQLQRGKAEQEKALRLKLQQQKQLLLQRQQKEEKLKLFSEISFEIVQDLVEEIITSLANRSVIEIYDIQNLQACYNALTNELIDELLYESTLESLAELYDEARLECFSLRLFEIWKSKRDQRVLEREEELKLRMDKAVNYYLNSIGICDVGESSFLSIMNTRENKRKGMDVENVLLDTRLVKVDPNIFYANPELSSTFQDEAFDELMNGLIQANNQTPTRQQSKSEIDFKLCISFPTHQDEVDRLNEFSENWLTSLFNTDQDLGYKKSSIVKNICTESKIKADDRRKYFFRLLVQKIECDGEAEYPLNENALATCSGLSCSIFVFSIPSSSPDSKYWRNECRRLYKFVSCFPAQANVPLLLVYWAQSLEEKSYIVENCDDMFDFTSMIEKGPIKSIQLMVLQIVDVPEIGLVFNQLSDFDNLKSNLSWLARLSPPRPDLRNCIYRDLVEKDISRQLGFVMNSLQSFVSPISKRYPLNFNIHSIYFNAMIYIYNLQLTTIEKVVTHESLKKIAFPAKEFSRDEIYFFDEDETDDSSNVLELDWNTEGKFKRIKEKLIGKFMLPAFEIPFIESREYNSFREIYSVLEKYVYSHIASVLYVSNDSVKLLLSDLWYYISKFEQPSEGGFPFSAIFATMTNPCLSALDYELSVTPLYYSSSVVTEAFKDFVEECNRVIVNVEKQMEEAIEKIDDAIVIDDEVRNKRVWIVENEKSAKRRLIEGTSNPAPTPTCSKNLSAALAELEKAMNG